MFKVRVPSPMCLPCMFVKYFCPQLLLWISNADHRCLATHTVLAGVEHTSVFVCVTRTALPWREAVGKVAPLAQTFHTQFMHPTSFSNWH